MTKTPVKVILNDNNKSVADKLAQIVDDENLPLLLEHYVLSALTQKCVIDTMFKINSTVLLIDKNTVYLARLKDGKLIKAHLNWQSLAFRIVSAGRKNELLLKACRVGGDMNVIDGTAGFGYDGLILASTGANVQLIEQNPIMALLLFYEYEMMRCYNNWHKLLGRITVSYDNFLTMDIDKKIDVVYLDPMFPNDSFNAKVGKHMQLLHTLAMPPTNIDEQALFNKANIIANKTIIKRPISASYLAGQKPTMSLGNDAIRFDIYESK